MKPDWADAPEWANYVARDDDGQWYWYERKPTEIDGCYWRNLGRFKKVDSGCKPYLEERPK